MTVASMTPSEQANAMPWNFPERLLLMNLTLRRFLPLVLALVLGPLHAASEEELQTKVNELKQAAQGEDVDQIRKLTEELQNTFHALSQQMYAQGQPQPEGGPSAAQDGDVIDGEVKE